MIKLIIFDLDGTLLNTIDDLANSCNYILNKYGFPVHPTDSYRFFVGDGISKLIERALPEEKRTIELIEKLRTEFITYYNLHSEDQTAPYDGIIDLLEKLQNRGIELAVASNKYISGTQYLVRKYFPNIEFVSVLGQREGIPTKPDPRIVFDIMKESNIINKDEILYVGDTGIDMETSTKSGLKAIGVLWGFRSREELCINGANFLVKYPGEILDICLSI